MYYCYCYCCFAERCCFAHCLKNWKKRILLQKLLCLRMSWKPRKKRLVNLKPKISIAKPIVVKNHCCWCLRLVLKGIIAIIVPLRDFFWHAIISFAANSVTNDDNDVAFRILAKPSGFCLSVVCVVKETLLDCNFHCFSELLHFLFLRFSSKSGVNQGLYNHAQVF